MREWIYGVGSPKGHEEVYVERYERHQREVIEYFRDRPADLLMLDLTRGEGWGKLCPFLGLSIPGAPFPHANAAPSRRTRLVAKLRRTFKGSRA